MPTWSSFLPGDGLIKGGFRAVSFISNSKEERKMSLGRYLFTSESVTEGHPDKLADLDF